MRLIRSGVVVLLCLAAASCAEDDGTSDRDAIIGELAALFDKASPGTPGAATCVAERLTDSYSPDELVEAGLLTEAHRAPADMPEQLSPPDAGAWVDASVACVDYVQAAASTYGEGIEGFDAEVFQTCVGEQVDADGLRTALVDSYSGQDATDAVVRLSTALIACAEQQK